MKDPALRHRRSEAPNVTEQKNFIDRWSDVINRRRIVREEIEYPRDAEIERLRTALKAIIDMIVYCPDGPKNPDSLPGCIRATAEQALNPS